MFIFFVVSPPTYPHSLLKTDRERSKFATKNPAPYDCIEEEQEEERNGDEERAEEVDGEENGEGREKMWASNHQCNLL